MATTPSNAPASGKPAKTYEALRAFSYPARGVYTDVDAGAHVSGLPSSVVHDLQTNHGEPVLREVAG